MYFFDKQKTVQGFSSHSNLYPTLRFGRAKTDMPKVQKFVEIHVKVAAIHTALQTTIICLTTEFATGFMLHLWKIGFTPYQVPCVTFLVVLKIHKQISRTIPSFRQLLEIEKPDWSPYKKLLPTKNDKKAFDEIFEGARSYASYLSNAANPIVFES